MTGQEIFELSAAIAGVCIGLAALMIFSLVAIIGAWQVFRRAGASSEAATRTALGVEELARDLVAQMAAQPRADAAQMGELRREAEALLEQERRLYERARELVESNALEGPSAAALSDLELAIGRLDATVGQMAASLANLAQLWEQQRR